MGKDFVQMSFFDLVVEPEAEKVSEVAAPDYRQMLAGPWKGQKYSVDQAKVLEAGFTLVNYRKETKEIFKTCLNPAHGWYLHRLSQTFAEAERTLKKEFEDPMSILTNETGQIPMSGGQNSKRLYAEGFDFYRLETDAGGHNHNRIKQGSKNWSIYIKADTAKKIIAGWNQLMTEPKALEG